MTVGGPARAAGAALRAAMASGGLRRLQLGWMSSVLADSGLLLVLLVIAYGAGGPAAAGLLTAIRMIPAVFAGPLVGTAVARRSADQVLLAIHLVRVVLALAMAAVLATGLPTEATWPLAAAVALCTTFVRPIHISTTPALARTPDELVAANVATSLGEGIGTFLGPLLGGFVLATAGPAAACAVLAGVFGIGAVATLGLGRSLVDPRPSGDLPAATARPLETVRAGFGALRRYRAGGAVIAGFGAQVVVRGALTTLIVVASIELLGMGESGAAVLTSALGAGALGGGLIAMGIVGARRLGSSFALALAGWGLPIAVIALAPSPALAIAALLAVGLSNASLDIVGFTIVQRSVPAAERVPIFGVLEVIAALGSAAGGLIAPVLVEAFGVRGALAIAGSTLPIAAVVLWPRVHRADVETVVPDDQLALIRGIPLFAPLSLTAIERMAEALSPLHWAPGETLIEEGEAGDRYLLIASGEAEVTSGGQALNRLGPGDGCGEISLIRDVPRTATVTAVSPIRGFCLSRADFLAAIAGPSSAAAATAVVEERLARGAAAGAPTITAGRPDGADEADASRA